MTKDPWKHKGWIWPRDRPGNQGGVGDGIWDVMRGKGPDMYIGDFRHAGPDWTEWARYPEWGAPPWQYDDSAKTPPWAHRGYRRYDPKKRKYVPLPFVGPFHPPAAAHWGQQFGAPQAGAVAPPTWNPWYEPPPPGAFQQFPQRRLARRHRISMPKTPEEAMRDWHEVIDFGGGLTAPAWVEPALQGAMMGAAGLPPMMGGLGPPHMMGGPPPHHLPPNNAWQQAGAWPGHGGPHHPHSAWPSLSSNSSSISSWPSSTMSDSDWSSIDSWP